MICCTLLRLFFLLASISNHHLHLVLALPSHTSWAFLAVELDEDRRLQDMSSDYHLLILNPPRWWVNQRCRTRLVRWVRVQPMVFRLSTCSWQMQQVVDHLD